MKYRTKAFLLRTIASLYVIAFLCLSGLWQAGAFSLLLFASCTSICLFSAFLCHKLALQYDDYALRKNKANMHKTLAVSTSTHKVAQPTKHRAA